MSKKTGRNDPCPCGSGKKFKHCCGARSRAAARASSTQTAPPGAVANVVNYLSHSKWKEAIGTAYRIYTEPLPDLDATTFKTLLAKEPELADTLDLHFNEWLLSDYETADKGGNPIDEYLTRRGWRETPAARAWLKGLRENRMSLYEIRRLVPGKKMMLYDALRGGEPIEVHERSATQTLRQRDYIATRIIPLEERNLLSGAGLHIPRDMAPDMIEDMRVEYEACESWDLCLRDAAPQFMAAYVSRFVEPPPLPELRTSDGEAMCAGKIRFSYTPERKQILAEALATHPDLETEGEDRFTWLERQVAAGAGVRVLGTIRLGAHEGSLEGVSRTRLERGVQLLRSVFPADVEFRPAVYEDLWQMAARGAADAAPAPDDIPAEEMSAVVKQVLDRQYANWCDEPIRALRGKTRRQAMETAAGRHEVIELLKDYENSNARLPVDQQYDYGWMWQALGLDRDEIMDHAFEADDSDEARARRRALIIGIIDNQMEAGEPPEVRQTYQRLRKAGHAHDEAMNLVGCALMSVMYEMIHDKREYAEQGYLRLLHNLPKLPWDDEE